MIHSYVFGEVKQMNNIKPCPFCGWKSRVHKYLGKWYARCNKCNAYSAPYDTEEQAAEAWNRRAGEPCDLCRHAPPSSGDGKPCTMCPAVGRIEEDGDK